MRGNPYHDARGRFASANQNKITSECIHDEHDLHEAHDLSQMGRRFFNGKAEHNRGGNWEIARGGYDLEYEVYHNGEPVFGCVDGEIDVYHEDYRGYAREFAKVSGDKCPSIMHDGSVVRLKKEDGSGYEDELYVIQDDALDERIERGEYNSNTSVYIKKIGDTSPLPSLFHTSIEWIDKAEGYPSVNIPNVDFSQGGVVPNNGKYHYIGAFVNKDELKDVCGDIKRTPLAKTIESPHITMDYKPKTVDKSLFGEVVKVKIVGYGCNEDNEGVKVKLYSDNPKVQEYLDKIEVPHITLSISEKGKAKDTKDLDFKPVKPKTFNMIWGGFTK